MSIRSVQTTWFEVRLIHPQDEPDYVTLRLQEISKLWFGSDGWLSYCRFDSIEQAVALALTLEPMIQEAWRLELALSDAKQSFINHVYSHTHVRDGQTTWQEPVPALVKQL